MFGHRFFGRRFFGPRFFGPRGVRLFPAGSLVGSQTVAAPAFTLAAAAPAFVVAVVGPDCAIDVAVDFDALGPSMAYTATYEG